MTVVTAIAAIIGICNFYGSTSLICVFVSLRVPLCVCVWQYGWVGLYNVCVCDNVETIYLYVFVRDNAWIRVLHCLFVQHVSNPWSIEISYPQPALFHKQHLDYQSHISLSPFFSLTHFWSIEVQYPLAFSPFLGWSGGWGGSSR